MPDLPSIQMTQSCLVAKLSVIQYMSPPAISTVSPINRILYSISIGSILNRRSPVFYKPFQAFEKYTPFNSHAKVHIISLSLISIEVWITGKQFNATSQILKRSLNHWLHI